jgi:hypothetical protein
VSPIVGGDRCRYCGNSFQSLKPGFYSGRAAIDKIGAAILSRRKGCNTCGVPACFDCAADAADRKGMKGHCICPQCATNLDE